VTLTQPPDKMLSVGVPLLCTLSPLTVVAAGAVGAGVVRIWISESSVSPTQLVALTRRTPLQTVPAEGVAVSVVKEGIKLARMSEHCGCMAMVGDVPVSTIQMTKSQRITPGHARFAVARDVEQAAF
jgi:hypothetical protein